MSEIPESVAIYYSYGKMYKLENNLAMNALVFMEH